MGGGSFRNLVAHATHAAWGRQPCLSAVGMGKGQDTPEGDVFKGACSVPGAVRVPRPPPAAGQWDPWGDRMCPLTQGCEVIHHPSGTLYGKVQ